MAIKKKHPDSCITLVAAKTNYSIPFYDLNPYVDRVLIYEKSSLKSLFKFYKQLRDRKYLFGVVPSTITLSRTSHIINFLSGVKLRIGVNKIDGQKNRLSYLLNIKKDFRWKDKHQLLRNLEIAEAADCSLNENEISEIRINFEKGEIQSAQKYLQGIFPDKEKKIIAFHPGAGKKANAWSYEKFNNLIKKLYNRFNCYVLITSGWTDNAVIEKIKNDLDKNAIRFKLLHNLPVKQLAAILSLVDLYITNDTGTMHLAGFSGAKMISLFGSTNPLEWAPLSKNSHYIKSQTEDINDISVDEVFQCAEKFLSA